MIKIIKENKGFISLTVTILVFSMILSCIFIKSLYIASFFDQVRLKEYRLINHYNALSCIDQAVLNLSKDYFFRPSSPFSVLRFNCVIDAVDSDGQNMIIKTHGDYKNIKVYKKAKVRISDSDIEVISIE